MCSAADQSLRMSCCICLNVSGLFVVLGNEKFLDFIDLGVDNSWGGQCVNVRQKQWLVLNSYRYRQPV